jgi:hypothetical protein
MAIRIRNVDGHIVALNARLTAQQPDDIYLDDAVHHALSTKFGVDFADMGFMNESIADPIIKKKMKDEEWKCTCPKRGVNPDCFVHNSPPPAPATHGLLSHTD